jgi:hypothetical protein
LAVPGTTAAISALPAGILGLIPTPDPDAVIDQLLAASAVQKSTDRARRIATAAIAVRPATPGSQPSRLMFVS